MLLRFWSGTAGELCDYIEAQIADGHNPTTPDEWDALMEKASKEGVVKAMGQESPN